MQTLARRGFLRGLASLPLIGGSVALIGEPTAAAVPVTRELLMNYRTWLQSEKNLLDCELWSDKEELQANRNVLWAQWPAHDWHYNNWSDEDRAFIVGKGPLRSGPSTRAALVLSTVGCGWTDNRA